MDSHRLGSKAIVLRQRGDRATHIHTRHLGKVPKPKMRQGPTHTRYLGKVPKAKMRQRLTHTYPRHQG